MRRNGWEKTGSELVEMRQNPFRLPVLDTGLGRDEFILNRLPVLATG